MSEGRNGVSHAHVYLFSHCFHCSLSLSLSRYLSRALCVCTSLFFDSALFLWECFLSPPPFLPGLVVVAGVTVGVLVLVAMVDGEEGGGAL